MTSKRILGCLLGAIVVFMWGFVAHTLLPIGSMGVKLLPPEQEGPLTAAIAGHIDEPGFYYFPGAPDGKELGELSPQEVERYSARYSEGPTGILVLAPEGIQPMSSRNLGIQFATCLLGAFLAAFILAHVVASYSRRVLITTMLGLFAWVVVSIPYFNWYSYPLDYTLGSGIDQVFGWFLGGLIIAGFSHHPRWVED